MTERPRVSPLVLVPPPMLFVLSFVLAYKLESLAPIELPRSVTRWPGAALIVMGALLTLPSVLTFLFSRTTLIPHASAKKLVVRGTYRVSRNPMYLGLVVGYLGVALYLGLGWPLVLLGLPFGTMQFIVIPFEEKRMQSIFGDEYTKYCARVRRWV